MHLLAIFSILTIGRFFCVRLNLGSKFVCISEVFSKATIVFSDFISSVNSLRLQERVYRNFKRFRKWKIILFSIRVWSHKLQVENQVRILSHLRGVGYEGFLKILLQKLKKINHCPFWELTFSKVISGITQAIGCPPVFWRGNILYPATKWCCIWKTVFIDRSRPNRQT